MSEPTTIEQIQSLQSEIAEAERELSKSEGTLASLEERHAELERELREAGVDMTNPEQWIADRQSKLDQQVAALTADINKAKADLANV